VVTTLLVMDKPVWALVLGAMAAGGAIGAFRAKTVEMTHMPELVAAMHSLVGLSAVLIAVAAIFHTGLEHTAAQKVELFIGAFIGAITFTASVIAYGKLSGKFGSKPVSFGGQHLLNLVLAIVMVGFGVAYYMTDSHAAFLAMVAVALVLGVTLIIPIGGADMPVVVSMLNSYSGWAAAGIGFTLNNPVLIISGACVGSSGAILSYIMCKAMNRSIVSVLLGGFGAEPAAAGAGASGPKNYKSGSAEDAAFLMSNADSVIIVPGYGLAVSRAQHALQEFAEMLTEAGVNVRYAIHPVAGRMPGHMNVLLAEAEVPYDQVLEMEEINSDFSNTDVVLVIGANDVVNPAAQKDKGSPIYGMPILEAYKARTTIVVKRSMNAGYAGLDNELFYMDKTMMVFGDAKKVVEDLVKAVAH
jgi:NAD(P) transhydrogenase subunit beta